MRIAEGSKSSGLKAAVPENPFSSDFEKGALGTRGEE